VSFGETVVAVAAVVVPLVGLQTFWIARALDRVDHRLEHLDTTIVRDHGERIARLKTRPS
jgi:hypothetical protein